MTIQWYPGHMAKAERQIKEETSKADVIIVLGDARAVIQSVNRPFYKSLGSKKHITVFNKSSLADTEVTSLWKSYYKNKGEDVFFTDCVTREGINDVANYMRTLKTTFRFEREVRAIVAGIPNVGKSLFINTLTQKGSAKTGNMPGVTRGTNWIKASGEFYLLDTPGVLPPKFTEEFDGIVLACLGCVKDTIFDKEEVVLSLLGFMNENYPKLLSERYAIDIQGNSPLEIYEAIAAKRGFILKGANVDYERCANTILDEFKNGKIGRMSFSRPVK